MNTGDVGLTVHYVSHGTPLRPDGTQVYTCQCRAAVVTEAGAWITEGIEEPLPLPDVPNRRVLTQVWEPDAVGLTAVNPAGVFLNQQCSYDPGRGSASWSCDGRDHQGGTWHRITRRKEKTLLAPGRVL
ncbi:MAG: hypothetical protein ACRDZY_08370 [Acidimicrobiales bacterium]